MVKVRLIVAAAAALSLPAAVLVRTTPPAAAATVPVVTLVSDSADVSTRQLVDTTHQNIADVSDRQFASFERRVAPATLATSTASASAVASQATSLSVPAAATLPLQPLDDISVVGNATAAATAVASSAVAPSAVATGSLSVLFSTSGDVPVFFSGRLRMSNADASDSCSVASVDLNGPVSRTFTASVGNGCGLAQPDRRWAESIMLPAGDYSFTVDYTTNVDDNANDKEPTAVAASAVVSTDLSFMPPTARFTKAVAGFRADFDGSASASGLAGRPLTTWLWNFGDGKTAATTKPQVSHLFPRSPRTMPTYRVTLQVIDSGHAKSIVVTHAVVGTATTATVGRTSSRLVVAGQVRPNRAGRRVLVTLSRRSSGAFHLVATHRLTLSARSRFNGSFSRPAGGTCRLTAQYAGDATHLASATQVVVRC